MYLKIAKNEKKMVFAVKMEWVNRLGQRKHSLATGQQRGDIYSASQISHIN